MILVLKPGKSTQEATSYRLIRLLPILSKVFQKLLLKRQRTHPGKTNTNLS